MIAARFCLARHPDRSSVPELPTGRWFPWAAAGQAIRACRIKYCRVKEEPKAQQAMQLMQEGNYIDVALPLLKRRLGSSLSQNGEITCYWRKRKLR